VKKFIIGLGLLVTVNLHAITNNQLKNLQVAYSIGKMTQSKDGLTFEKTLAAMMLTESSARTGIDGDDGDSLGAMQMQIPTIRWMGKVIPEVSWVNSLTDRQIATKLAHNVQFACLFAGYYVQYNYNQAMKRHMTKPYFRTISRYNGGWNNKGYYSRVMKNMKLIKKLVRKGKLK